MPDCPNCNVTIGLCEIGAVCPVCKYHYLPLELVGLPDYNFSQTAGLMTAFCYFMETGLITSQIYHVEMIDGGFAVKPLGVPYN